MPPGALPWTNAFTFPVSNPAGGPPYPLTCAQTDFDTTNIAGANPPYLLKLNIRLDKPTALNHSLVLLGMRVIPK